MAGSILFPSTLTSASVTSEVPWLTSHFSKFVLPVLFISTMEGRHSTQFTRFYSSDSAFANGQTERFFKDTISLNLKMLKINSNGAVYLEHIISALSKCHSLKIVMLPTPLKVSNSEKRYHPSFLLGPISKIRHLVAFFRLMTHLVTKSTIK